MNYLITLRGDIMNRYYLKILALTNIIMLNIAQVFLFFKCEKIANIIIRQAKINSEYIERCIL